MATVSGIGVSCEPNQFYNPPFGQARHRQPPVPTMRQLTVAFPPRPISSMIEMDNIKLAVVGCIAILTASPAAAQGGGDFGLTLPQNVGPRYLGDEEKDVGGFGGVDGSLTKEAAACCVESGFATRTCRRTITQAHRYARSLVEGPERIAVQHVAVASLPADVARAVCAGGEHPLAL